MAESEEEIIIIEDSEAAAFDDDESLDSEVDKNDDEAKKKKILIFGAIAIVVVLLIVIIFLAVIVKSKKSKTINTSESVFKGSIKEKVVTKIEPSKLEKMIAKANYLYEHGSKSKALKLYEQIALYSEGISQYNLGVAQLKNKQYKVALSTFQRAINNNEKRCVSAINAAVCCVHIGDEKGFKYYIDLAYAYLPYELNSPLYSYYHALINYYKQRYFEAIAPLKYKTLNEYPQVQKHLKAKIDALFGNDYDAIEAMEENLNPKEYFSIGLLYARVGDLTIARKYLEDAIDYVDKANQLKIKIALTLINLKLGTIDEAARYLKDITKNYGDEVYEIYPIKVVLKDSLFDPLLAQQYYRKTIPKDMSINYQKLFYFSPYKVFNANQTISYIRKGSASIYIDNIDSAKQYLKKSVASSSVNIGIVKAIQKALKFHIRQANTELKRLVKIQPKHSILQYDLALTYAQLGDMQNAHKHFLKSYYLDAKNYLSGVYAIMTGQLTGKVKSKMVSIYKDSLLEEESDDAETKLCKILFYYSQKNTMATTEWLNEDKGQKPLSMALKILVATQLGRDDIAKYYAQRLSLLMPNEILPHLMYIDSAFIKLKQGKYAKEVMKYLKKQKFNYDDLYFGPYVSRFLYIQQNLITGRLHYLQNQLEHKLKTTDAQTQEIMDSLALVYLYDKNFEKSYVLFNQLIDQEKLRDAQTLFLGAVASTAAKHHENAIALLELSKLKNPSYDEARYALGILYMQINNYRGASIQFAKIPTKAFGSKYFTFRIDTDKLLFKKQHPKD